MSILIKGMSGCECCADCEFCGGLIMPDDIYVCDCPPTRGMDITMAIEEDRKHPDCPLAELPEKHGRLIDESIVLEMIRKSMGIKDLSFLYHAEKSVVNEIYHAPTVIEAEGEEQ